MRKTDTLSYKIKACSVFALLVGLFAVLAAGCSKQEEKSPEYTSDISSSDSSKNSIADFFSSQTVTTMAKITLPTVDSTGSYTGSFSGGRPTETKATLDGNKITMGEVSLIPITKPAPAETAESTSEAATAENTRFPLEIPKGTIETGDFFVIGEDTTATMVYGFN